MSRSVVTPGDQSASFVELFFDLVFVFCITQIVALLHDHLSWVGVGHGILVFWLVWWAWTQFTWALNAADTTHPFVELGTIAATALAFLMAVAIPGAFAARASWFAVTYVLVRSLGLWIYARVARTNPGQHEGVRLFALVSTGGLAAVLVGGFAGATVQPWLWGLAIFLDVIAALVAGQAKEWDIHAEHFAERHGLIVIIALGESLVISAAGLADAQLNGPVIAVAILAVLVSCALWWTYFPVVKPELERALAAVPRAEQGETARDVFSLAHFPMLCGVIAYALAVGEAIAHPSDPLSFAGRLALALGLILFIGGTALAMWRATCGNPYARVVVTVMTATVVLSTTALGAAAALGSAFAGVATVAALDELRAHRLGRPVTERPR